MDPRTLIRFMHAVEPMKYNTRHSWTSTGRHESVAEHSWRLALMAFLVKDEFPEADMDRVVLMCLCHDLGEAVTGDIPAFEKTESHRETERRAVEELFGQLPEPACGEMRVLFSEMEKRETLEAKIYKALDAMECLIQHNEADISTWLPLEYELNLTYGSDRTAFSPYLEALRREINRDSMKKERESRRD